MGLNKNSILLNIQVLISILQRVLLWATRFPSIIKNASKKLNREDGKVLRFYKSIENSLPVSSSSSSSSSSVSSCASSLIWANSANGDLLGTESGVHCTLDIIILQEEMARSSHKFINQTRRIGEEKKLHPPPIPSLAHSSQKLCFLSRSCLDDRLILRHETGKSYQCFEAIREDGRLLLNIKQFQMESNDDDDDDDENFEEREDHLHFQVSAGQENYDPLMVYDSSQNGSVSSLTEFVTFKDGISNTWVDMHGGSVHTMTHV